jgi:hypothetical protein
MRQLYYSPSGETPMPGFVLATMAGIVMAALAASLYAYVTIWLDLTIVTLISVVVLGVCIGWLGSWVMRKGRVRNRNVATAGVVVIALVALHANWVIWTGTYLHMHDVPVTWSSLLFDPAHLWKRMVEINAVGAWTLDDETVRGGLLWVAWSIEAILIVGLSINYARRLFTDMPYCEECGSWCTPERGFLETTNCKAATMRERMEAKDFAFLDELGPRRTSDNFFYRFDMYTCPGCGATNTLTIDDVAIETDYRDRESRTSERVVHNLLLDGGDVVKLRAIAEKFVIARAASAE